MKLTKSFIALLVAISAISPFATDSYLSAIPIIANDLGAQTSHVAITVSLYILGLSIGQLFGGPLSDRLGRKPVIVVGLLMFAIASIAIGFIDSLHQMWCFRVIQAIGGGVAVVGVPAIIRDRTTGKETARLFSLLMFIGMIAPSIAPSVGTLVLKLLGWHWIFIMMGIFAVVISASVLLIMPKQVTAVSAHKPKGLGYAAVFRERKALGYLASQGFGFAVLMCFLTNVAFAYIEHFGVSEELFSALLVLNVLGVGVVNRINSFLLHRYEPSLLLQGFLKMQIVAAAFLVFVTLCFPDSLVLTVIGFVLTTAMIGGVMPNSAASFMHYFPNNAGTASATLGASQYMIAAMVSAIAALLSVNSLVPLVLVMITSSVIALLGAIKASRSIRKL
ncbi:Bcr/CflA family drug resistance efflux transporter [Vibrio sp. UCD-FRSSP16_10]|uniref:multidrug effflux MFS transporter n=1 Tax=unclassified Vibrio TaxID=2614977 RepID=UPI0007FF811A|nr:MULTISPECIES: multidrug effflux MFS transporter [unclassified Vibrio]OBT12070.1 Bcr/CflA family drug resistance efflux transporter [Vibrio sp. UCD-FRSSP16_30]OBT20401.1 Bcr/CflA family drug resistance efflux transporter [Vibrio sp. UCD-FRSSP16_10]